LNMCVNNDDKYTINSKCSCTKSTYSPTANQKQSSYEYSNGPRPWPQKIIQVMLEMYACVPISATLNEVTVLHVRPSK